MKAGRHVAGMVAELMDGMGINGPGGASATRATPGKSRSGGSARQFTVSEPAASGTTVTVAGVAGVNLDGMLALQEHHDASARDEEAKRHGDAMLIELAAVQRALLSDGDPASAMQRLSALAASVPPAADPRLAWLIRSIALRGRVELARRGLGGD